MYRLGNVGINSDWVLSENMFHFFFVMYQGSRSWFVTINNFEERDVEIAKNCGAVWGAVGWHVGEKSGLPHVHIALRFKAWRRMSAIVKLFPRGNI